MQIRRYRLEDADAMAEVLHYAVHHGAATHYTTRQRAVWSPAPNPAWFRDREADGRKVWVAESAGAITGFIELEQDGHIDCFYCHPRGEGSALFAALEAEAGEVPLRVEASDVARPFFERRGFAAVAEQVVERGGVPLRNNVMVKPAR